MDKISIIIPFYNGNKYLNRLVDNINSVLKYSNNIFDAEVVFVNDSPGVTIDLKRIKSLDCPYLVINNKANSGIHQSRVNGLNACTGNYILFLDQDDLLTKNSLQDLYTSLSKSSANISIGNGYYDTKNGKELIFNIYGKALAALLNKSYFIVGNMICSPGQCLIRKDKIPVEWKKYILKTNCSDDLFLWMLMINKRDATFCNKVVYHHIQTGSNTSNDDEQGIKSDFELLNILKQIKHIDKNNIRYFEQRCLYRKQNNNNFENKIIKMQYILWLNAYKIFIRILPVIENRRIKIDSDDYV